MRIIPLFLSILLLGNIGVAAEPRLEQVDLFHAGEGGYELYRIPGVVVTPKGTVLAYCEARRSSRADWGHIDILMRRSTDGGKTWSQPKQIVKLEGKFERNPAAVAQGLGKTGEITINNPVAIVDAKQGIVHFLYCVEYNRCFHMTSSDDGKTFSKPQEITATLASLRPEYAWQACAIGPGHGIQLKNGRLLAAVWLSTGKGGHAHRPSVVSTIYSDDGGKTWERGEIVAGETMPLVNPSESILVERTDGSVLINMRSESKEHRRAVAISPNGATNWTTPQFDDTLLEPVCMACIIRLSDDDRGRSRIAFANPDTEKGRTNVSVKLSYDEGATWPINKVLEPGPSAYSDLAAGPDGSIYCLYERAAEGGKGPYGRLTIAKFNPEWLTTP